MAAGAARALTVLSTQYSVLFCGAAGPPSGYYAGTSWPTPTATTDKEGRFTLRGLAKGRGYILVADPDEGTKHLHRFARAEDTAGFDPIPTGLSLLRGVILTGRVTDAATGAAAQSRVFYRPLEKNAQL